MADSSKFLESTAAIRAEQIKKLSLEKLAGWAKRVQALYEEEAILIQTIQQSSANLITLKKYPRIWGSYLTSREVAAKITDLIRSGVLFLQSTRAWASLKKYWKEMGLFLISIGVYLGWDPIVHAAAALSPIAIPAAVLAALPATLPITLALLFWIMRTDNFKALWTGKGGTPSPEEKILADKIAEQALPVAAQVESAATQTQKLITERPAGWELQITGLKSPSAAQLKEQTRRAAAATQLRKRLRLSMIYLTLGALMFYPLQGFALARIAESLAGLEGKALLYGQLLGMLYFGQLIPIATQTGRVGKPDDLPGIKLPWIGLVRGPTIVQALVVVLAATWMFVEFMPWNIPATLAATALTALLIWLSKKISSRTWTQYLGLAFAVATLATYFLWGHPIVLLSSIFIIGMFYGPSNVALQSDFQNNAKATNQGAMAGVQGAFFNGANSIGYALIAFAASLYHPAFPGALLPLGLFYAALIVPFLLSKRRLLQKEPLPQKT